MASILDSLLSLIRFPVVRKNRGTVEQSCSLRDVRTRHGHPLDIDVVRFDGIGDWILCIPLINALKNSPDVRNVRLIGPASHQSLLDQKDVTFVGYKGGTILQPPAPGGILGKVRAVSWNIGRRAYSAAQNQTTPDAVIIPRWDTDLGQNARAWASGAGAIIIGFDPALNPSVSRRESHERTIISQPVADNGAASHEITHTRNLLTALGLPSDFAYGYGEDFFSVQRSEKPGNDGRPYVILHTSSVEPKRRWPAHSWRELIAHLVETEGVSVGLIGSPGEHDELESLREGHENRVTNLAGAPLGELPSTLAGCHAFIGNDSGPMHVASSLNVPVVCISPHPADGDPAHRNSPLRFGPWAQAAEVLQPPHAVPPCRDACIANEPHCITEITPKDVVEAFRRVTMSARPSMS